MQNWFPSLVLGSACGCLVLLHWTLRLFGGGGRQEAGIQEGEKGKRGRRDDEGKERERGISGIRCGSQLGGFVPQEPGPTPQKLESIFLDMFVSVLISP